MPPAPGRTLTTRTLTRRSFVKSATGLAAVAPGLARAATQQPAAQDGTLFAYVGTYSSAPVDTPPGKVDLPPGNGRGIHVYRVDRATGGADARERRPALHEPECARFRCGRHARLLHQRHRCRRQRHIRYGDCLRRGPAHGSLDVAEHREPPAASARPMRASTLEASTCWSPTTRVDRLPCCRLRQTDGWARPPT